MQDFDPAACRKALPAFHRQGDWPLHALQTPAAVLVGLIAREQGWCLLLTRRTDHLHHHPGQISFPGGRHEDDDADLIATALREAEEEVGIPAGSVDVLGCLPRFATPSGFCITPVVALLPEQIACRPDPFEVAEVFELPLDCVCDVRNFQQHRIHLEGGLRQIPALPFQGRFIWGATAGVLMMLAAFLAQQGKGSERAPARAGD